MSETQSQLDVLAATISTAVADIAAEIANLKAAATPGTPGTALDFSGLDAAVASLAAVDPGAIVTTPPPPPAVVPPVAPPTPPSGGPPA